MEKTLAEKRPAWKTRKTAFPTFPQLRLRVYYKSKSTTKTKPSYDPVCGQWGQVTPAAEFGHSEAIPGQPERLRVVGDAHGILGSPHLCEAVQAIVSVGAGHSVGIRICRQISHCVVR